MTLCKHTYIKVAINNDIPIKKLRQITQQNLELYRNRRTHSGDRFDVIKSALQKYIRRGLWKNRAEWVVREMHLIYLLDINKNKNVKACVTNFLNRILTIAVEDVSPREYEIVRKVFKLVKLYRFTNWNIMYLAKAVYLLCIAKKSRSLSHLRAIIKSQISTEVHEYISFEMDMRQVENVLNHIYNQNNNLIDNRLALAKSVYIVYHNLCKNSTVKQGINMNMKRVFSRWILKLIKNRYNESFLLSVKYKLQFFLNRQYFPEEIIVILSIFDSYLAFIYSDSHINPCIFKLIPTKKNFDWINDHKEIKHPLYVYDKHTGGRGDKSMEYFVNESSKVFNEDVEWQLPEIYRQQYKIEKLKK